MLRNSAGYSRAIFRRNCTHDPLVVFPLRGLLSAKGQALQPGVTVALTTVAPPDYMTAPGMQLIDGGHISLIVNAALDHGHIINALTQILA